MIKIKTNNFFIINIIMMAFQKHISTGNEFAKKASILHSFGTKISHHNRMNDIHHEEPKEKPKQTIEKK